MVVISVQHRLHTAVFYHIASGLQVLSHTTTLDKSAHFPTYCYNQRHKHTPVASHCQQAILACSHESGQIQKDRQVHESQCFSCYQCQTSSCCPAHLNLDMLLLVGRTRHQCSCIMRMHFQQPRTLTWALEHCVKWLQHLHQNVIFHKKM